MASYASGSDLTVSLMITHIAAVWVEDAALKKRDDDLGQKQVASVSLRGSAFIVC